KELKTYADGTKKANLDVEIAVDMLSLADKYDTAVLVSGDEDFAYAINAVAYKGVRVELAGFRANTSPRLIDVADQFIELDSHVEHITKAERQYLHSSHSGQLSGSLTPPSPSGSLYGNGHGPITQPLSSDSLVRVASESREVRVVENGNSRSVRVVEESREMQLSDDAQNLLVVEKSREIDMVEDTVPDCGVNSLESPLNRVMD